MNRYIQGQVLVLKKDKKDKRKVLGVCGDVVHLSMYGGYETFAVSLHYKQLESYYDIVEEDWKPKKGEEYWYIDSYGDVCSSYWNSYEKKHDFRLKTKNAFRTREQAEARLRELTEGE